MTDTYERGSESMDTQTYFIRYNHANRGHILISCCYGHPVESVKTDSTFAGSAAQSRISFRAHKCHDCETLGFQKAA